MSGCEPVACGVSYTRIADRGHAVAEATKIDGERACEHGGRLWQAQTDAVLWTQGY